MQGIRLPFDSKEQLQKACKGDAGTDTLKYRDALAVLHPDPNQVDPIKSMWNVRLEAKMAGRTTLSRTSKLSMTVSTFSHKKP